MLQRHYICPKDVLERFSEIFPPHGVSVTRLERGRGGFLFSDGYGTACWHSYFKEDGEVVAFICPSERGLDETSDDAKLIAHIDKILLDNGVSSYTPTPPPPMVDE